MNYMCTAYFNNLKKREKMSGKQLAIDTAIKGGIGLGYNVLGGIVNNAWEQLNAEQQHERNLEVMALQHAYNEKSADAQMRRNLEIYNQTQSTQAKIAEMKAAGLSVGMLQGTPSQGGASGTESASTSALGASKAQTIPLDLAQAELAMAQAENIREDTKGKRIDNEVNIEWASKTAEETYNKLKAEADGQEIANDLAELQLYVNNQTAEATIQELTARAVEASNQANISGINYDIAEQTKEVTIKMATEGYNKLLAEVTNIKADTALKRQQIRKMKFDMKLAYQELLWDIYDIQMEAWDKKMDHYDEQMERKLRIAIEKYNGKLKWEINERNIEADYKKLFIEEGSDMFKSIVSLYPGPKSKPIGFGK